MASWNPAVRRLVFVALMMPMSCVRDPEPDACPDLGEGDVVVSELRGHQAQLDADGQWIELGRPDGESVDLRGLRVELRHSDGANAMDLLVRTPVQLDGGAFAVLGLMPLDRAPTFVDASLYADAASLSSTDDDSLIDPAAVDHDDLPTTAVLELWACETRIDTVRYGPLPSEGTLFAGGNDVPDGQQWCSSGADQRFGTPRAPNPACP